MKTNRVKISVEELCSFTRFETQCRTPESPHKNTAKMCVWCVFETHTHSARVQKLNHGLLTSGLKPDFLRAF